MNKDNYKIVLHEVNGVITADLESIGDYTLNTIKTLTIEQAEAVYKRMKKLYKEDNHEANNL